MRDDAYIPERPANDPLDLARTANNISASSTLSGDVNLLIDGVSRDELGEIHHWQSKGLDAEVIFEWNNPIAISSVEIKCDTNVKKNIMMLKNTRENQSYTTIIPPELIKSISLELKIDGIWQNYGTQNDNQRRLIKFNFDNKEITAFKIKAHDTYGAENIKLFEVRCYNK